MKLSKVKKVCVDSGAIIVKKAACGLDINTWIGTNSAMYPVRGMTMNAGLAVRIWEIEPKRLRDMEIMEDTEEEAPTLITQEDLEDIDLLVDTFVAEEEAYPGLLKIATINGYVLLADKNTKKGWVFGEDKLGPVEGNLLMFLPVEEGRGLIKVYGNGELEAVIFAARWNASEFMKTTIRQITEVCREEA